MIKPENIIRGPYTKYGTKLWEVRCDKCGNSYETAIQSKSTGLCVSCTRARNREKAAENNAKRLRAEYERGKQDGIDEALGKTGENAAQFEEMRLTWAVDHLQRFVGCNAYGSPGYCDQRDCSECSYDHDSEKNAMAAGIVLHALMEKLMEEDDRK